MQFVDVVFAFLTMTEKYGRKIRSTAQFEVLVFLRSYFLECNDFHSLIDDFEILNLSMNYESIQFFYLIEIHWFFICSIYCWICFLHLSIVFSIVLWFNEWLHKWLIIIFPITTWDWHGVLCFVRNFRFHLDIFLGAYCIGPSPQFYPLQHQKFKNFVRQSQIQNSVAIIWVAWMIGPSFESSC